MGLNILGHQDKSVAPILNDVFVVKIMWNQGEDYEELPSCVGFTPPSPKWKVELQSFGNNSCKFLIPDYDSVEDATIELLEYSDLRISDKIAKMLSYVFDFNADKWWYLEKNIYEIVVEVYDNTFSSIKYTYVFRYIKITKYNNYDLSYTDDSPVKWSISFNFMYYKQYAGVYQKDITAGVDTENYNYEYEKANNSTAAAAAKIAANEKAPDISSDLDKIGGMNSSNLDNDAAEKVNEEKAAEKKAAENKKKEEEPCFFEEEAKQKNGEKSEGVGCKDPLDGILTGNSRAEYYDYLAKLKEADPSFDPEHSSYIYYDMATNTKYAIKDGKLVKTYTAYTATGDSAKKNGEAAEGVYQMYDVKAGSGVNSSKHAAKKQATEKAIAAAGLKVDDLEKEVASGKYKSMAAAMRAHGIDTSKIKYTYKDGDGKTITKKMNETDFSYSSYSKYGNNMIDEGNNNGYRETTASGINSHVNYKENDEKVKAYEAKKAAGTNTAEDDKAIRDYLSSKSATQGCSVMSSQDTAWEKQFMEENGGKVYEIKGNGTSASNKHNDSKHPAPPEIGYSQERCVANDVTTSAPADALSTAASTPNQIPQVENTTETNSTPPAEAVAPATPAPSNDQEFVFEDVEVKADAEPPKTSGVDVSGMTAAAADEATKEQQAANVQDRANELIKKVHCGEINSKGGWVSAAKKEGYTDEEIQYARDRFNSNTEYKANWNAHVAEEKAQKAEAAANVAKVEAGADEQIASTLDEIANKDQKAAEQMKQDTKYSSIVPGSENYNYEVSFSRNDDDKAAENKKISEAEETAKQSRQDANDARKQADASKEAYGKAADEASKARAEADAAKKKADSVKGTDPLTFDKKSVPSTSEVSKPTTEPEPSKQETPKVEPKSEEKQKKEAEQKKKEQAKKEEAKKAPDFGANNGKKTEVKKEEKKEEKKTQGATKEKDAAGHSRQKNADGTIIYHDAAGNSYWQTGKDFYNMEKNDQGQLVPTTKTNDIKVRHYNGDASSDYKPYTELVKGSGIEPEVLYTNNPNATSGNKKSTSASNPIYSKQNIKKLAAVCAQKDIGEGAYKGSKGSNYSIGFSGYSDNNDRLAFDKAYNDYMQKNAKEKPKQDTSSKK